MNDDEIDPVTLLTLMISFGAEYDPSSIAITLTSAVTCDSVGGPLTTEPPVSGGLDASGSGCSGGGGSSSRRRSGRRNASSGVGDGCGDKDVIDLTLTSFDSSDSSSQR